MGIGLRFEEWAEFKTKLMFRTPFFPTLPIKHYLLDRM